MTVYCGSDTGCPNSYIFREVDDGEGGDGGGGGMATANEPAARRRSVREVQCMLTVACVCDSAI